MSLSFSLTLLLLLSFVLSSSSSMLLQGKRVLVTGAGRGIGRAIALICQEEGAKVAITSRTESELKETMALALNECSSKSNPQTMTMHVADVTNPQQVESMIQRIVEDWGGLDVLINNAGGAQRTKAPVDDKALDSESLTKLLQLNVVGAHVVTSAVLQHAMPSTTSSNEESSSSSRTILNISSRAGKVGLENYSFYVASKFALEGMTSSWAKELKGRNPPIRVHSISPGMVNTQSFPKPPGKKGVRTAESIRDCLLLALTAEMEYTGHYIHADELDMIRSKGLADTRAWKPIDEPKFDTQ